MARAHHYRNIGHLSRATPAVFLVIISLVGVVVGLNPAVGVLLALSIVFTLAVTWDLAIGVCGFLLLTFLDVLSGESDVSLTKAAGALLVVGWVAASATGEGKPRRDLIHDQPGLTLILVAFLAWSCLSALWADSPSVAYASTLRFGLNAMLIPIVYMAVQGHGPVAWILGCFVAGALLSVAYGVTQDPVAGASAANAAEGRLSGATAEANVLATMLMVAILFAGTLALALRGAVPFAAPLATVAAVVGLVAFFATFSRGGLVSFAAMLLVGLFYGGRRLRPALVALALVAAVIGALVVTSSPGAADRLTSASTSGRSDIWTVAVRMAKAHPVLGVGSGNFTTVEAQYLIYPGAIERDDLILDQPLVAHNVYLHLLAELGAIGLVLFVVLLAMCLASATRAVAIFQRHGLRSLELFGRALVIAIAGILAADFFASEQYSKQLWLLLAMGPALLAIAREESGKAGEIDAWQGQEEAGPASSLRTWARPSTRR